jgi:putative inorganic carbon (hco3(-)) transporter
VSAASAVLAAPARIGVWTAASLLKALQTLLRAPEYVFLAALTAMLFRPPDLKAFPVDRAVFLLLVTVFSLRLLLRREHVSFSAASWPMLFLLVLGLRGVLGQPYDVAAWSILAAQWIVPLALFHIAGSVFSNQEQQRKLQWFSIAVLVYLSLIAVFWLFDLRSLIFPRFILDGSLGIHSDRARGPFLQAVANGVSINVLGIVALHWYDRPSALSLPALGPPTRVLAGLLFVVVPLALLATETRAVWLGAALSAVLIVLFARGRRSRALVTALTVIVALTVLCSLLLRPRTGGLEGRLEDRSPIEFRLEMYRAGLQMFAEKPLLGWGSDMNIQPEIERRISSFHPEYYIFHNTYLQLAIQYGAVGVLLYAWVFVVFFRLGARSKSVPHECPFGPDFGLMWRIMLCVYLLNASVVVMNYQFLNGYMFTIAGILAAQPTGDAGVRS